MNKKETAELEQARKSASLAVSLGWPCVPRPTPVNVGEQLEGKGYSKLFVGWAGRAWGGWDRTWSVSKGCSNGCNHCDTSTTKTSTQGVGRFFKTRLDALLTARWELCEAIAKQLAEIDAEIAKESAEPTN